MLYYARKTYILLSLVLQKFKFIHEQCVCCLSAIFQMTGITIWVMFVFYTERTSYQLSINSENMKDSYVLSILQCVYL